MIKATPIKFKNLPSDIKTRLSKLNGGGRKFVKDVYKDELLLYWKAAGGVGLVIYGELKFQKGFEKGNMIKIGVFGYGTIGKRVADAVILQDDMELVGVTANKVGYLAGMYDDGDIRYIRITNLDDTNYITLTFRDEDNTEFRIKVDAGHSFIYPGDNNGGVVDTMKAAGSALASGLADLVDITVDTDTAACDVEVFVASV